VNRIDELYRDSPEPAAFAQGYLDFLNETLARIDVAAVASFIRELLDARERNARIFFFGNGGSAATASHFVNDISIGSKSWSKPFRASSLVDNAAVLTAIANDDGYDEVFIQQLRFQLHQGDLVVAISVSGNSPNVVAAVEYAKSAGARTVALTGFDGGKLHKLADVIVHVPTNPGEYGVAEDAHMVLDHLIGAYLAQLCKTEPA
jgi:D-sedoheptulose 7-phosphate isomerase